MERQFSVIDIFCGIGGMSKGFLDAGYQVKQAMDLEKDKVSVYNSIFGGNIAKCQDVRFMDPKEMKDADVIAGRMPLQSFSVMGQKRREDQYLLDKYMADLVHEKMPKAIVLETSRIGNMREACDRYAYLGYHVYYKRLAGQSYSGLPFYHVMTYLVGIRKDLGNRDFNFPQALYDTDDIDTRGYLFEKNVDAWYRTVNAIENYRFEENKIYVRRMNKFYESNLFMNGIMTENFLCDREGLRRCTHIEMARLKGLTLYDYNKCKNKRLMYRYISQATNAIVITYIAIALREYLSGKETACNKTTCFSKKELIAESSMRLLEDGLQYEKIDSGDKKDADPPKDEWDKLIEAVNDEEKNNLEHGRALEKLMLKFFSEVEGFQCQLNARTETEEIDIWILNMSKDELFAKESNLILCECKNWRQNVSRSELSVFLEKMKNRNGRCKLGFFIAWNGVTGDFKKELLRITRNEEVVVLLSKEGIISAIKTGNITKYLQNEYSNALLR